MMDHNFNKEFERVLYIDDQIFSTMYYQISADNSKENRKQIPMMTGGPICLLIICLIFWWTIIAAGHAEK